MSAKLHEHPVISSVIAGMVLWAIAWIGGYLLPFWQWVKEIANIFYIFITQDISMPLWVFIFATIPFVIWLYNLITKQGAKENKQGEKIILHSNADEIKKEIEDDIRKKNTIELSSQEDKLMRLFIEADGRFMKPDTMTHKLNTSNLKLDQILESLVDKGLVKPNYNAVRGTSFGLTREGRDHMMGNEFENT